MTRSILRVLLYNILRLIAYLAVVLIFASFLFEKKISSELAAFFYLEPLPDTFKMIVCSSVLFLIFTITASAIIAAREQNHFKTSFVIRILLFGMNIVPIALFQHVLFKKFGFRILYFVIFYLALQMIFDLLLRPLVARFTGNSRLSVFMGKIIPELLVVLGALFLVNSIRAIYPTADMRYIEMYNPFEFASYIVYIVLFNSVTFFTVEYCITLFRDEYKKNYVKYYFLFNNNYYKRILYIIRNTMPRTLDKIRKNLSWLVMFIIAVDSIFENIGSIGSNLLDIYNTYDGAEIITKNVFYILIVIGVINTITDSIIVLLKKVNAKKVKKEQKGSDDPEGKTEINTSTREKITKKHRHRVLKIIGASALAVLYIYLFAFNRREYAFAGYYDFEMNRQRTVQNFLDSKKIGNDQYTVDMFAPFLNTSLCEKTENPAGFSLIVLDVQKEDGNTVHLIPYFDKTVAGGTYYFIENNVNVQNMTDIYPADKIVNISRMEKYSYIPFTNMTSFRLQADIAASIFGSRPLYVVLHFYLFYFLTLLFIVAGFTAVLYGFMVSFHFSGNSSKKYIHILGKASGEIIFFFNSITLIVVFMLVNIIFQKSAHTEWVYRGFISSFFAYTMIQMVITVMFSDCYINEVILYIRGIARTNEFKYYNMIGMNNKNQAFVFNKKYGFSLLLKLIFQNILFVININWFISYAFNVWKGKPNDYIGVTYALSFENIFTKIIHFESTNTSLYNFIILLILDALLFAGYFYNDNKLRKR